MDGGLDVPHKKNINVLAPITIDQIYLSMKQIIWILILASPKISLLLTYRNTAMATARMQKQLLQIHYIFVFNLEYFWS